MFRFLSSKKRTQSSLFSQLCAPVELPERFPFPQAERVAPSVVGCRRPAFSEYRPEPVLLPESFCVPLRRRARRSLPIPSSDDFPFQLLYPQSSTGWVSCQSLFCAGGKFSAFPPKASRFAWAICPMSPPETAHPGWPLAERSHPRLPRRDAICCLPAKLTPRPAVPLRWPSGIPAPPHG